MEPRIVRFSKINHKDFFVLKALCEADGSSLKQLAGYLKRYSSEYGIPLYKRQEWCRVLDRLESLGLVSKTRSACCFYRLETNKAFVQMYCAGMEGLLRSDRRSSE